MNSPTIRLRSLFLGMAAATATLLAAVPGFAGVWSTTAWTGDASTNIVSGQTLWAYHFGSTTAATINGVTVTGINTRPYSDAQIDVAALSVFNNDGNTLTSAGGTSSAVVAKDFFYQVTSGYPIVKNLTIGQSYTVSFLSVGWDAVGGRPIDFTSGADTLRVDQDQFGNDYGVRVDYTFTATAVSQSFTLTTAAGSPTGGTWHLYGLALKSANSAPTDIALSASSIAENNAANATVGTLSATDADAGDTHTHSLVSGTGSTDNASFTISGSALRLTPAADYETKSSYTVRVRATDSASGTFEEAFTITITNVNEAPSFSAGDSQLAYETVTPIRSSNNIIYSVNNATALAGTSFSRVTYRMETQVSGVLRYAETSFDAWSGLTVAGLAVPTPNAPATIQRNVTNMTVDSNYSGVVNATVQTGRLEIWPYNYSQTASAGVGGSSSTYDFDDTSAGSAAFGSFQVHNLSSTPKQTVLAWNNHSSGNPDVGFGNRPTGEPDWTFAAGGGLGITNWKLQIYIGTDGLPSTFTVTEDVDSNLLMGGTPFVDADSGSLTVTLAIDDGVITGNAGTGVTVGGTATARTFSGTVSDLNTYFTTAGKLTYLGSANNTTSRTLTITADDGVTTPASTTAAVNFTPVNDTPTDIALSAASIAENNAANATVGTLSSTDADASDTFTYTLVSGTGSTDNGSFTISGNALRLTPSANYEAKSSYAVRVRSTDAGGLFFEEALTISITDVNETPTDLALSNTILAENVAANTTVGTLSSTDVDAGDTFTYTLVSGTGSTDNSAFNISGSALRITSTPIYAAQSSYAVRVRATDSGGLYVESQFTISVIAPEISVEASTVAIADGGSKNVGAAAVGSSNSTVFTIKNIGSADLTGLGVTIDGTHASNFTVTSAPAASIAGPTGQTTFTVQFQPSVLGIRTAVLHIASNDNDENPFDITLTGKGGKYGAALAFDGVNDAVVIPADAAFNTSTFTVEGWVKPDAGTPQWSRLWGTEDNQGDLIIKTGSENRFSFAPVIDGQFAYVYAPTTWTAGLWYHVAGVVDHTMIRLFVNGVEVASRSKSSAWAGDAGVRYIGRSTSPKKFKGVIDEVRYWNYARNCDQISQARTGELTGAEDGLVAYYPLNHGVADSDNATFTVATDATGHGHDGTLTNVGLTEGSTTSNWTTPGGVTSGFLAPVPQFVEINVTGNGVTIRDADDAPALADHTDFGDTTVASTRTFTLENSGNIDLTVSSIDFSGANAGDFVLGGISFPATIAGGASTTFTVTVAPSATDLRLATVTIASTDCDEGAYDFVIQSAPPIAITTTGGVLVLSDPTAAGGTLDLQESAAGFISFSNPLRAFTVDGGTLQFSESGAISLTGITQVTITGNDGNDTINVGAFTTSLPSLTISGGLGEDTLNFTGDVTLAAGANLTVSLAGCVQVAADANVVASGNGAITIGASKSAALGGGSSLETEDGNLSIEANQQATPTTGNFAGITLTGGWIQATGTGAVTVKGTGGNHSAGSQAGVRIQGGGDVISNTGLLTVEGTGGPSSGLGNYGVQVTGTGSTITSTGGHVRVIGIEGTGVTGVAIAGQNSSTIETTAPTGSVTMIGNSMLLDNTTTVSAPGTGSVTLVPFTNGVGISLGLSSNAIGGPLSLTDTELDRISAGTLNIGDSASGTITQTGGIIRAAATAISLTSGADIAINAYSLDSAGGNVSLNPGDFVTPTSYAADVNAGTGTLSFGGSGKLAFAINSAVVNSGYTQLSVAGTVNLAGATLNVTGSHVPLKNQSFILVNNDGVDPVLGAFTGLAEHATVMVNGVPMTLSYAGGTGNDVTLSYAAPTLTAVKAAMTVNEGSLGTNTGTLSDLQGNVILTADTGSVTNLGNGTWSWAYTPADGPNGPNLVTITATDDSPTPLTATVSFSVTVANVTPVAQAQTLSILEGATATPITLVAVEPGADTLTYEIVTPPVATKGTLGSLAGNVISFTPVPSFAGQATFTFKATDSDTAVSNTATVTVNVTGINDAPAFVIGANRSHLAGFSTAQSVPAWATGITDSDAEVAQTLSFHVSEIGSSGIFTTPPAITSAGALSYRTNGTAGTATLSVELQDNGLTANGGDDTSDAQTFTITVAADSTPPTVTISSPLAAAKVPENTSTGKVTVTGTAADNKALQKVEVQINGGGYADAVTTIAASGLTATYTLDVTPLPGLNTLTVRSTDTANLVSTVVTRSFTYVVLRPFAATITPVGSGTVTYTPALVSGKAQIGTSYTLKATAATGYFFDYWDGSGVTSAPVATATLPAFVMTEIIASTADAVTAHFMVTPFRAGTYTGLANAASGVTPSQNNLGLFSGTLTATGSFSGRVNFAGTSTLFTATFDAHSGDAARTIGAFSYDLHLDLDDPGTDKITGTVVTAGGECDVDADRCVFSVTNKTPDEFLKAGDNTKNGIYTVVFPALPSQDGLTSNDYPQGDGIGTLTVTPLGVVSLAGALADGTTVTASAKMSKIFAWPMVVIIKSTTTITGMTLGGMVQFDTTPADSDVAAVDLQWFRPARAGAPSYPSGWPAGISTYLTGAKFATLASSSELPGLDTPNPAGNAVLEFQGGLLTSTITKYLNISSTNIVTKIPTTDTSYTLSLSATTGAFSGTFTPNWASPALVKPTFKGILIQKGDNQGGYGFFLSNSTGGTGAESGNVTLSAP